MSEVNLKDITLEQFAEYIDGKRVSLTRQILEEGSVGENYNHHKFLFNVLGEIYGFKTKLESK